MTGGVDVRAIFLEGTPNDDAASSVSEERMPLRAFFLFGEDGNSDLSLSPTPNFRFRGRGRCGGRIVNPERSVLRKSSSARVSKSSSVSSESGSPHSGTMTMECVLLMGLVDTCILGGAADKVHDEEPSAIHTGRY